VDHGDPDRAVLPADILVRKIIEGGPGEGRLANDLLAKFFEGYPVTELRRLFRASEKAVVEVGVWLASELGAKGRPLIDDIVALLDHPSIRVRYFAVDFMMTNVRAGDTDAIRKVVDLIDDPARAVRTEVMKFLAVIADDVALAAQQIARQSGREVEARGLDLIVDAVAARNTAAIRRGLADQNDALRRYAGAAAARLRNYDRRPLEFALRSDDPDLNTFATEITLISAGRSH
jgi:hypothetical protein